MPVVNMPALDLEALLAREWLAVNHIGGYASSTPPGLNTRKYHGLLVAAMAPPVRRMVVLSRVEEQVRVGVRVEPLFRCEYPGVVHPAGPSRLRAFSSDPFPRWAYQGEGWTLQKELQLLRGSNTVCLTYTLLGGDREVELELRPLLALRPIHELMYQWNARLGAVQDEQDVRLFRIPATCRTPEAFFAHDGQFDPEPIWYLSTIYRRERERGYAGLEDLWMPGAVRWKLSPGKSVHFVCSTDPIDLDDAVARTLAEPSHAAPVGSIVDRLDGDPALESLHRAAGQFVLERADAPAEACPAGGGLAMMTGFPWPAPSVREALVAFTGLLLVPRRFQQARGMLLDLVHLVRNGLLPTELAEDGSAPKYDGADVALWFVHAVWDYLRYTADDTTVRDGLFQPVVRILRGCEAGTDLGIVPDADGLLITHAPARPTTWMNAKVGDWVITPRQGRPVELNALWYSSLRIVAQLCRRFDRQSWADDFDHRAVAVQRSFNSRFWNEPAGCCFDVVNQHGVDAAIRPNQLLAISLPFPVLDRGRYSSLLSVVRALLLSPRGVRTLAPNDPSYQGQYRGDVVLRDRAYHQGSAFPWLLGPYVTAQCKAANRSPESRRLALEALKPCLAWLQGDGLGQIPELFDGNEPQAPGGAIASAASVGEVLRCYVEDVLDRRPAELPRTGVAPTAHPDDVTVPRAPTQA